jgi:hypothetical protein
MLRDIAPPPDRKIKGLILNPLPRLVGRGAKLRRGRAAREISIRAGDGMLTNKAGDEFTCTAGLDPGEEFAAGLHGGTLNH